MIGFTLMERGHNSHTEYFTKIITHQSHDQVSP
jgi:hypothetical protein